MSKNLQHTQYRIPTTPNLRVLEMLIVFAIGVLLMGSFNSKANAEIINSETISKTELPEPSFMKEMSQVHYFLWIAKTEQIDAVMAPTKTEKVMVQLGAATTLEPIMINLMMSPNPRLWGQKGIIRYDLSIFRPDGRLYDPKFSHLTAFEGVWPKEGRFLLNGPDVVGFRFESKDSLGTYTIIMGVSDEVTGQKVQLQTKLEHLAPAKP